MSIKQILIRYLIKKLFKGEIIHFTLGEDIKYKIMGLEEKVAKFNSYTIDTFFINSRMYVENEQMYRLQIEYLMQFVDKDKIENVNKKLQELHTKRRRTKTS